MNDNAIISIIIPTLNEAKFIRKTLKKVQSLPGNFEFIVVDGRSSDGTAEAVAETGVKLVSTARGRGPQMNAGACAASGNVLLFLHADTALPENAYELVQDALQKEEIGGGCFRLKFDSRRPMLRFYSFCSRIPCSFFQYGDCAYFVRTEIFQEIGGFKSFPLMEDVDFWRRLKKRCKTVVLRQAVTVSARRFLKYGAVRQQLRSAFLLLLYLLGIHPTKLKKFYPDVR